MLFGDLSERFLDEYVPASGSKWSPKTRRNYEQILKSYAVPKFGEEDPSCVDEAEIQLFIDGITRDKPEQGIKLYKVLRTMLGWASQRKLVSRNPMEFVQCPGRYKERERVLGKDEIRHVWRALDDLGPTAHSKCLKMIILTWQRRQEVAHLPWVEIDDNLKWWHQPVERSKTKSTNPVFLSKTSRALLESQRRRETSAYCFPGQKRNRPISKSYVTGVFGQISKALVGEGKLRRRATVHDLRRSGATMARKLGADRHVVARILNHKRRDTTRIYDRYGMGPEVKQTLSLWSEFVGDLVGLKPGEF